MKILVMQFIIIIPNLFLLNVAGEWLRFLLLSYDILFSKFAGD
jgi:hypothetical protein